jgi:hypothetical protein
MLTFVEASGGGPGPDITGPATSNVSFVPSPTNGTAGATLSANVDETTTGGANVVAAEYFVNVVGANGSGTSMSGAFSSPTVAVSFSFSAGDLAGVPEGSYTIYVHGLDALGNWGNGLGGGGHRQDGSDDQRRQRFAEPHRRRDQRHSHRQRVTDCRRRWSIRRRRRRWFEGRAPTPP